MEIEVNEYDEVITVTVIGDIDLYTSKDFKNTLFEVSQTRDKNIEIDFSRVDFMDSAGIGVLISLYKIQKTRGKKLVISKANADVINFVKLSNLTYLLEA
ncbi:MAG TPA: STAS domain-containing protein [Spirochaetota bacterium]|nr:STAS domain-containing protein [Spirochaetota bacterium]HQF10515.1 STAS domain-containing protein [Spirochaetota bacterium]HQH99522.1 STAS domain-containing protein [Spirochaetota bacterium]HQJ73183.1 STAS domain-containing protein [Spirochaetota bacterium]